MRQSFRSALRRLRTTAVFSALLLAPVAGALQAAEAIPLKGTFKQKANKENDISGTLTATAKPNEHAIDLDPTWGGNKPVPNYQGLLTIAEDGKITGTISDDTSKKSIWQITGSKEGDTLNCIYTGPTAKEGKPMTLKMGASGS